ncbi:hypothetical protein R3I94_008996 [Phoxinus phoxinus]
MGVAERVCVFVFLLQGVCCGDFSISLTEKIEALSGSCLIIKCTFEIAETHDKDLTESAATGFWLKDGTDVNKYQVFNSRNPKPNHFKGEITGKLHKKNCTTIFYDVSSNHNGKYYFRIESGLKYTYTGNTSTVNVIESPPKPTVKLYKDPDQEEVLEGSSVRLRCSAETLCSSPPPTLTWSFTPRIPLSESSRQQELLISDLNFTATHRHHRVTFTCTITYQLQDKNKTAQDNITLHVQYPPKNTSVSVLPSGSVLEGSSVTLTCSSDANPAVLNYTWSRKSERELKQLRTGDTLTFNKTDPTQRGWYHCTAQNKHGCQESSVMLDIQYPPKNTSVSVLPSGSVLEGSSVTLTCSSDANPAVLNYTWSRKSERELKQLRTGDTLTFNKTDPTQRGWYHCTAQNKHGCQESSVMLDIQYAPKISPSSGCNRTDVTVCFCEVDGNPSPELKWLLSGRPVSNSSNTFISEERLNSTGLRSSITLHQSLTHTSSLQCVGNNNHGTARKLLQLNLLPQAASLFNVYAVLVGFVAGATFMAIVWVTTLLYKWICRTQRGDKTGLIRTDVADTVDSGEEPFYVNKVMLSAEAPTINHLETLHYSTINFNNTKPVSEDIKGISSLTVDYAVVRYYDRNVADSEAKIREVTSMPHKEDTIYQVPHKARRSADMDVKQGESI